MSNTMEFVKGIDKLAFYGVSDGDTVTYHRMRGFDSLEQSSNPQEYSRKYVDEAFERSDIIGYSPSLSFSFDQIKGDMVHDDIVSIADEEKIGSSAVRNILVVDLSNETETPGTYNAKVRAFSVIIEGEKREEDYKYNGTFKTNGDTIKGTATTTDGWQTCTFAATED